MTTTECTSINRAVKQSRDRGKKLTGELARRAIAIDFEGRKGSSTGEPPMPSYIGAIRGHKGQYRGWILDDRLAFLAKSQRELSRHVEAKCIEECFEALADRAEREDRLILHFSQHEVQMLHRHAPGVFARVSRRLADGKAIMTKAVNRKQPGHLAKVGVSLTIVGEVLCPQITARQDECEVGKLIGLLEQTAKRTKRVSKVPPGRMRKWLDMLEYNRLDVRILQKGAIKAANIINGSKKAT